MPGSNYPGQGYFGQEYPLLATGGDINASLNITEADDTLSAAGTLPVTATLSATEANDTLSSAGTVAVSGSLGATEAADSIASTASVGIAATLALTEASDTLTADGTVADAGGRTADLNVTEANDTLAATGSGPVQDVSGGNYRPWRLAKVSKKKKTEDEELAELAAFLRTVAEAKPKIIEIERPPVVYHGPLAAAFYEPRTTKTVNEIISRAKADAQRREDDDEEALLLLLD
jgi:hypothetical protein